MRTIKLKSLSLVNFKGIRSLNIGFSDAETLVAGENGTGKTTVFDSFLWLLFGKDSTGRSDSNFNIKTLDSDGKPILHLEHSVTGVLSVDGKTVTLQRCYVENWVKPRGTTEESLKNHATEFYLNGVKLATKKEYDSEVAAIIPEDVFRMITNPFYFTSMKPEAQKEILLDMVGTLTDQDVAQTKPEYLELLAQLSGRSIAQYAKEVAAKKKACKDELSVIPSQIETARKLMPEEEDWVAIDSEIEDKNARIQQIEEQIADKSKLNEQEYQRKAFIQKQIGEKRLQLNSRMNEIATEANKGRNEASLKLNELEYSLRTEKASLDRKRQSVADMDIEIEKLNTKLSALRGEFSFISKEELTYPFPGAPFLSVYNSSSYMIIASAARPAVSVRRIVLPSVTSCTEMPQAESFAISFSLNPPSGPIMTAIRGADASGSSASAEFPASVRAFPANSRKASFIVRFSSFS